MDIRSNKSIGLYLLALVIFHLEIPTACRRISEGTYLLDFGKREITVEIGPSNPRRIKTPIIIG